MFRKLFVKLGLATEAAAVDETAHYASDQASAPDVPTFVEYDHILLEDMLERALGLGHDVFMHVYDKRAQAGKTYYVRESSVSGHYLNVNVSDVYETGLIAEKVEIQMLFQGTMISEHLHFETPNDMIYQFWTVAQATVNLPEFAGSGITVEDFANISNWLKIRFQQGKNVYVGYMVTHSTGLHFHTFKVDRFATTGAGAFVQFEMTGTITGEAHTDHIDVFSEFTYTAEQAQTQNQPTTLVVGGETPIMYMQFWTNEF